METIYIIGNPLAKGEGYKDKYERLAQWESALKDQGYQVVNPLKLISQHTPEKAAKKQLLSGLMMCDSVLLLNEWKDSDWGRIEFQIANWLEFNLYTEKDYRFLQHMAETLRAATPLVDIPEGSSEDQM